MRLRIPLILLFASFFLIAPKSLHAQWSPNTVTITFDSNGGGTAPATQTYTYGVSGTLPGQGSMSKDGYEFKGWSTSSTATTAQYQPGTSSSIGFGLTNSDHAVAQRFYAVWTMTIYAWGSNNAKGYPQGTDEQIAAMVAKADRGELNLLDYWDIGEIRYVHLNAMDATHVGDPQPAQNVELVIVAKDTTIPNTTNPCYNYQYAEPISGGRSYPSFIVQQKDVLTLTGYMNRSASNFGSWKSSARNTWCNNTYVKALPSLLQSIFKRVRVKTSADYYGTSLQTSTDYFFLPAEKEILGSRAYSAEIEANSLAKWQYYTSDNSRIKTGSWWERSPYYGYDTAFCVVTIRGLALNTNANNTIGIAPCGCI